MAFNFNYIEKRAMIKPPKLIKGSVEDLQILKKETIVNVIFDYTGMEVAKMSEQEWVDKQKMKGVEDEVKAKADFNAYWYNEIRPLQEQKFIEWYNNNSLPYFKVEKGRSAKYTLTIRPTLLLPFASFGTIAALTSHVIISDNATNTMIAVLEIPNINAAVPALKERVAMVYGATGKAAAVFFANNIK
jgi:hypothetical protein